MDIELYKIKKKELKLTFADLSERSGVPKRTLEDIFSGHTPTPRVDTVQAIEKALGIAPEQIEAYTYGLTDDEKILIDYYRRLNTTSKITVFNIFKSVFAEAKDIPIDTIQTYMGELN